MNPLQTALVAGALTLASGILLWGVKVLVARADRARAEHSRAWDASAASARGTESTQPPLDDGGTHV